MKVHVRNMESQMKTCLANIVSVSDDVDDV